MSMVDAALAAAQRGLPVFPLWPALPARDGNGFTCGCGRLACDSPAKHPLGRLVPRGALDATVDAARVAHLWAGRPDAGIGVATETVVVIDIDPRHGGTLDALKGPLPPTWRVITGGGGEHIYFRAPAGEAIHNSAGKLAKGVDVRATHGYVCYPPTRHISGQLYAWQPGCDPYQVELAPLPSWLQLALVEPAPSNTHPPTDWTGFANDIGEGARNSTIARLAGHLLRRYVDPRLVIELVLDFNAVRCKPPLAADEVVRTIQSIAAKEFRRRAAA
jgi:hypothetical protein